MLNSSELLVRFAVDGQTESEKQDSVKTGNKDNMYSHEQITCKVIKMAPSLR